MNIIKIILSIGLWFLVIVKGYTYLKVRDQLGKNEDTARQKELKKIRNSFLEILAVAVIYTYINLSK